MEPASSNNRGENNASIHTTHSKETSSKHKRSRRPQQNARNPDPRSKADHGKTTGVNDEPQYIQEMQQQLLSLQENVKKLEKNTENLRRDHTDVDILTQHMHDTLYTQQQRDAARQTVAKGWPKDFSEEWDAVIKWYMEKANVDNYYTTTHGRCMHGRYKRSQITIIHWKEDWAKQQQAFESYVYKWYNKRNPVRIWDKNKPHRISFVPQASDMEREINLTIQAALRIVTKPTPGTK